LVEIGKDYINRVGTKLIVVDDVAREAGISKGSFYSFFPSREDFILSVFESWEKEYRDVLLDETAAGEGAPRERLERFFLQSFAILEREPGLARMGSGEIDLLMERLPKERLASHQDSDKKALDAATRAWIDGGLLEEKDLPALIGIMSSIFAISIRRQDFAEGSYEPAIKLISEALAARLARKEDDGGRQ
jgi:AcrR family transcriptional regulator